MDAARKRLRKLSEAEYIVHVQPNRMQEALFRLGREGKCHLERFGEAVITLERTPPTHLEHFLGVTDLRIAAELSLPLSYFFAYWELSGVGWKQPIIPDAVFGMNDRAYAIEFDRGQENLEYFRRTKLRHYISGLDGFPVHRLLIVTDRQARLESLAKCVGARNSSVLLARIDLIRQHGFSAPIFFDSMLRGGQELI